MTAERLRKSCLLRLRVSPNASRNEVTGLVDDILQVKIAAPPVKGKANQELVAYLSKLLELRKSSVTITGGFTSRSKAVNIDGLTCEESLKLLLPSSSSFASDARSKR